MRVTFLGTGTSQGVPLITCKCKVCTSPDQKDNRLRSSILIEDQGFTYVIDTGPDFRQQMLRERVDKLDAVVFTHEHKDHIAGLDDIRAYNFSQQKEMDVYATERVQEAIKREFPYVFDEFKYPGVPEIKLKNIDNSPFTINKTIFTPIAVMHLRLPVLGFRINDFTYITDANFIAEEEKKKAKNSKVLVLNALRKEVHPSHFTLQQALDLVDELKPETAYFTHISHQLGLHEEVSQKLPANVHLAHDGLILDL